MKWFNKEKSKNNEDRYDTSSSSMAYYCRKIVDYFPNKKSGLPYYYDNKVVIIVDHYTTKYTTKLYLCGVGDEIIERINSPEKHKLVFEFEHSGFNRDAVTIRYNPGKWVEWVLDIYKNRVLPEQIKQQHKRKEKEAQEKLDKFGKVDDSHLFE